MNPNFTNFDRLFVTDKEKLFFTISKVFIIGCTLAAIFQLIIGDYTELRSSLFIIIGSVSALIIYAYDYKKLAYHLMGFTGCAILLYMVIINDSNYRVAPLIYPVLMLFYFIFFERLDILIGVLIFLIINQIIVLYHITDANINGMTPELWVEFLIIVVFNIIAFLMCNFYMKNIRKARKTLVEAKKQVQKQNEMLREKNETLSEYIDSNRQLENYTSLASHELRAPLRSVKSFAQILGNKLEKNLDQEEKELFAFITDNAEKMSVLLEDLNTLGKIEKSELRSESIDLKDVFTEILYDRQEDIQTSQAEVELGGNVQHIVGQRSLIKQLFSNLIGNAIKFVEKGTKPKVKIESKEKGDTITFKVEDNGIGIRAENRHRIFQIFTRLHSEAEYKGSGIGLAICKKIVDLHKGSIAVDESQLGGTCFIIRLPKLFWVNPKSISKYEIKS